VICALISCDQLLFDEHSLQLCRHPSLRAPPALTRTSAGASVNGSMGSHGERGLGRTGNVVGTARRGKYLAGQGTTGTQHALGRRRLDYVHFALFQKRDRPFVPTILPAGRRRAAAWCGAPTARTRAGGGCGRIRSWSLQSATAQPRSAAMRARTATMAPERIRPGAISMTGQASSQAITFKDWSSRRTPTRSCSPAQDPPHR
jgi:hypothetical protein